MAALHLFYKFGKVFIKMNAAYRKKFIANLYLFDHNNYGPLLVVRCAGFGKD